MTHARAGHVGLVLLVLMALHAPKSAALSPRELVDQLAGTWTNALQYRAAPDALKVEPSVDGEWLDLQYAAFHRVDAPAVGDLVLYLEWRRGAPDGDISRQRLWSFRTDADGVVRMDFHAFVDGEPYAGRGDEPGAFAAIERAALRSYAPECALRFVPVAGGWVGRIGADECRITAASGRTMGIDAEVSLGPDGVLEYREAGRLDDGRYAFRVPPTMPYRFVAE
jgi:hypothetical protein